MREEFRWETKTLADELDARQDQVLTELDRLNDQIEAAIREFLPPRDNPALPPSADRSHSPAASPPGQSPSPSPATSRSRPTAPSRRRARRAA